MSEHALIEVLRAAHPMLGLAELSRLSTALLHTFGSQFRGPLFSAYGWHFNERLNQIVEALALTPLAFQNWVDEKRFGARDLSPLLSLNSPRDFDPFLHALSALNLSKSEGAQALELGAELILLDRPLSELLPQKEETGLSFLKRLELWRRPLSAESESRWQDEVGGWPWPSQVRGQWQRFGDQTGLEIRIQTTSPEDLEKKLARLKSIGETWACKN